MAYQELLFSKPSIAETIEGSNPCEGMDSSECAIFIGALSTEEFDRLKQIFAEY
jgi:hypothetical protein